MYYYSENNRANAYKLRRQMTPWECKLWFQFLKDLPCRFYRQKRIGNYIVDFYCAKYNLVIELDGSQHYNTEDLQYDEIRTKFLNDYGIKVLRYTNDDVYNNFNNVCGDILNNLK